MSKADPTTTVQRILADLKPAEGAEPRLSFRTVSHGNFAPPGYIVGLLLLGILQFRDFGPSDKVTWSTFLTYRDRLFMVRDYKFGSWSLECRTNDETTRQRVVQLQKLIQRAAKHADRWLSIQLREKIHRGEYHINNVFPRLYALYSFHMTNVRSECTNVSAIEAAKPDERRLDIDRAFTEHYKYRLRIREAEERLSYVVFPLLSSFYSMLECLLATLYAFKQTPIPFAEYQRLPWKEQFKSLFPVAEQPEWKRIYDALVGIKEQYRNPLEHGLVGEPNLLVSLPWSGLVPVSYEFLSRRMYHSFEGIGIGLSEASAAIAAFHRFEMMLREWAPMSYWMAYLDYELSVPVDQRIQVELAKYMTSPRQWLTYLILLRRKADRAMDRD